MNNIPKFGITIPHSYCIGDTGIRTCDLAALKASSYLHSRMKENGAKIFIYMGDQNRTVIDYNRKLARFSRWRMAMENKMIINNIDIALDIHSFPPSVESFGYFDPVNKILPEVVILDSYVIDHKFLDPVTSTNLLDYLIDLNIKVMLMEGGENDIMVTLREKHKRAILIEFNEGLQDDRLKYIADMIVDYFIGAIGKIEN